MFFGNPVVDMGAAVTRMAAAQAQRQIDAMNAKATERRRSEERTNEYRTAIQHMSDHLLTRVVEGEDAALTAIALAAPEATQLWRVGEAIEILHTRGVLDADEMNKARRRWGL